MSLAAAVDELFKSLFKTDNTVGLIRPTSSPVAPPENPFGRDTAEIISQQQQNAKGFRVIDIDPNVLDRPSYYPIIDIDGSIQLVGNESTALPQGFSAESGQLPFWRTVALPFAATWLKIEYLPSPINDFINVRASAPDESALPTYPDPANPNNIITLLPDVTVKYASERIILLNFDSTTDPPLIVKPGNVYKIPFNVAYITFKVWSPRIRVTFGYNTEIIEQDDRALAMSPAYGPGHGLLNNQVLHSVPFCITHMDCGLTLQNGIVTSNAIPKVVEDLIANPSVGTPFGNGMMVGWITGLSISSKKYPKGALLTEENQLNLYVASYPSLTPLRRLCAIPWNFDSDTGANVFETSKNLVEPIRFTLHAGEALILVVETFTNDVSGVVRTYFSLEGYTYGNLSGTGMSLQFAPFVPQYKITDEPYPQDRNIAGAPRL